MHCRNYFLFLSIMMRQHIDDNTRVEFSQPWKPIDKYMHTTMRVFLKDIPLLSLALLDLQYPRTNAYFYYYEKCMLEQLCLGFDVVFFFNYFAFREVDNYNVSNVSRLYVSFNELLIKNILKQIWNQTNHSN